MKKTVTALMLVLALSTFASLSAWAGDGDGGNGQEGNANPRGRYGIVGATSQHLETGGAGGEGNKTNR
jgi:hypothetical protein